MKKSLVLLLCCIAVSLNMFGRGNDRGGSCPKVYIGPSLGINNPAGFVGAAFDVPVTTQFSLGTGIGLSTWGWKTNLEGRFYFRECNRGWALAAGATYNTGIEDIFITMPTTLGEREVLLDLEAAPAVFFSGYHFFSMGSRHRFYLQMGYTRRFDQDPYTVKSGDILTSDGKTVLRLLAPGGVMFGFGFSFGIGG